MKKVFEVLNQMVTDGAIENYAVAGAIGAMFYIEAFSTQDIDVLTLLPKSTGSLIAELPGWKYLQEHGYTEIRGEAIVVDGWPLQLLPVGDALEREAYLIAQTLNYEGTRVRVVLAEHLVAIMLKVGRLKDYARIQTFLSQDAVDIERLEEIIGRHGLESKWAEFRRRFLG